MAKPCYHCAELLPDSSGLHTPSHYSKRKEQRREHERDRDKVGGLKKKKREKMVQLSIPEAISIVCHQVQSVPYKARALPSYFPNATLLSDPVSWPITVLAHCSRTCIATYMVHQHLCTSLKHCKSAPRSTSELCHDSRGCHHDSTLNYIGFPKGIWVFLDHDGMLWDGQ